MRTALALLLLTACGPSLPFVCADDGDCAAASGGGRCETTGYCSFPDDRCASGRRYGAHAGELADACVLPDPHGADGSTSHDSPSTDDGSPESEGVDPLDAGELDDDPGGSDDAVGEQDTTSGDSTTGGTASWWDCSWTARRTVAVDAPPLVDVEHAVPIPLVLAATRIDHAIAAQGGADLRVVIDGEAVPHEIEAWHDDGTSWIWVALPQVPGTATLELYYGGPADPPIASPAAVWDATHVAVWHLGPELSAADDSGIALASTATVPAAAVVDEGRELAAADSALASDDAALDGIFADGATVSMWIRPDSWGGNAFGRLLDKSSGAVGEGGWMWSLANEGSSIELLRFVRAYDGAQADIRTPASSIALGQWQHVALVFDEDDTYAAQYYVDGVAVATELEDVPFGAPVDDAAAQLVVGNRGGALDRAFDGTVDEVRVSSVVRSAGWIALEAAGARDELLTYGPPEAALDHGCP